MVIENNFALGLAFNALADSCSAKQGPGVTSSSGDGREGGGEGRVECRGGGRQRGLSVLSA